MDKKGFWKRVRKTRTCWLWINNPTNGGYGQVKMNGREGKSRHAHVVAYELLIGPVPMGKELDHVCRVKLCVRPSSRHVEAVSHRENCLRGSSFSGRNARKRRCKRGHRFTVTNTYCRKDRPGHRHCRRCSYLWKRKRRA